MNLNGDLGSNNFFSSFSYIPLFSSSKDAVTKCYSVVNDSNNNIKEDDDDDEDDEDDDDDEDDVWLPLYTPFDSSTRL